MDGRTNLTEPLNPQAQVTVNSNPSIEDLIAQRSAYEKSNNCALWSAIAGATGTFIGGLAVFLELAGIVNDAIYPYQRTRNIEDRLKILAPSALSTAGFFGFYRRAKRRLQETDISIARTNREIKAIERLQAQGPGYGSP